MPLEGFPREDHPWFGDDEFAILASKVKSFAAIYRDVQVDSPLYLLLWAAVYGGVLLFLHRLFVKRERIKYVYYITDFWALILSLLPFYAMLGNIAGAGDYRGMGLAMLNALSILLGVWAWMILSAPKPGEALPGRWNHFVTILSGGFVGWLGIFLISFALAFVPLIVMVVVMAGVYLSLERMIYGNGRR